MQGDEAWLSVFKADASTAASTREKVQLLDIDLLAT